MAREITPDTLTLPTFRHTDDGVLVTATTVIGTTLTVLQAWEPCQGHTSLRSTPHRADGSYWGLITSRPLPFRAARHQPGSPERIAACEAVRAEQELFALAAILRAYPEVAEAGSTWRRDGGTLYALDAVATEAVA